MPVPTHAEWKALKKKHGIPDGAVSGINLGKVLDNYHVGIVYSAAAGAANAATAETATGQLSKYLTKLDKKKVKTDYPGFNSTFLNKYVAGAKADVESFKRTAGVGKETYATALAQFFTLVQRLTPGNTTQDDLETFRDRHLRDLAAVGSALKGYDLTALVALQNKVSAVIDAMPGNTPQAVVDQVVTRINAVAQKMAIEARTLKLI